jgi:hypothetical protein
MLRDVGSLCFGHRAAGHDQNRNVLELVDLAKRDEHVEAGMCARQANVENRRDHLRCSKDLDRGVDRAGLDASVPGSLQEPAANPPDPRLVIQHEDHRPVG